MNALTAGEAGIEWVQPTLERASMFGAGDACPICHPSASAVTKGAMDTPFSEKVRAFVQEGGDLVSFIWALADFEKQKLAALSALGKAGEQNLKHYLDLYLREEAQEEFHIADIKAGFDLLESRGELPDLDIAPYGPAAESEEAD